MTSAFTETTQTREGTGPAPDGPAPDADASGDTVRMGVFVPSTKAQWSEHTDPREAVAFGVRAERTGFDSLWTTDSLLTPRLEALTALAALAAVTERVTLGTGALLPALRTPVQAAQTIASVDLLSGGRLVLGVGAGFPGRFGRPVYAMAGTPWENRFTRLDETVALWRRLWTSEGPLSFHGKVLHFDDLLPATRPFRPGGPPVWLGGATPAALARTGRLYDGWLPYPPDPADYGAGLAAIRAAAGGAGRADAPLTPALFVNTLVTDAADGGRAALDAYARANYGLPVEEMEKIQANAAGTPEAVVEQLGRYVAQGARHLVIRIAAPDIPAQLAQLDRLVALRPALNALLAGVPEAPGAAGGEGPRPDAAGVRRR
ncbi:LLM class flavin-dependent oxidoreductase [Streptomyces cocklensis]|jgi:alkanesulfonate monooxygenase SsuD/methylene tetrahydromethanopterin reductase-like flavin-dependent oxidoreductase (luciferase family)|uniref:Flavin-dependent oxidoreductase, luciferase family (Includes alkanesulfonate monooxygenase SsuD and methylene tetrahydromethanopterin reductase) n=1 Tax=Actinacidiphila cocklensis TaxID=887465 RepID=A0A9W4GRD2_9ACTN|nr:LLM class flavin-dependent oxidoreductase [Actinacidiphila cocklensis]MDD1060704.1 LLM class flavin-dependent oxidoreductase [Actinacidiphila cocklensis]WSX73775.1 LLM class flavin-dependent oxidoreductase [Streptomyces sp. NBC_00899]WSX80162.1 LLM class flavin-dependent oxidoreductase [Streptomyces sp. NBC_00899]CAG6394564.1 Flavin-dependent oxidoreductase, luciferase family (Includes alkanesulfonate monooxygenase SsuD and methylene tetrahydromethanopterin reductase) [Actinacidiphila cockle